MVTVRAAERDDIAAIMAIYAPAVRDGTASFEYEPPDEAEMARRWQAIVDGGYPYLVAVDGGQVVGYAYASSYRPRAAYRYVVENSIYIAPGRHGQGVGRILLQRLVEACTARGFRQMIAVIGDSRQQASIGLHRSLGFTFVGVVHAVGFKHGRWLDQVLMQLALGEGDTTLPA